MSRAKIKQIRQLTELKHRVTVLEEAVESLGGIVKALVMVATGKDAKIQHIIDGEIISLDTVSLNPPGDDSE